MQSSLELGTLQRAASEMEMTVNPSMMHNKMSKESEAKQKEAEDRLAAAEKLTRKLKTQLAADKKGAVGKSTKRFRRMTKKSFGSKSTSRSKKPGFADLVGAQVDANREKAALERQAKMASDKALAKSRAGQ